MKLLIHRDGCFIRAVVENANRESVGRSWPWPNNSRGRELKLNEALEYTDRLSKVLLCPVEIAESR